MQFSLPSLAYPLDALQPYISARTLEFHHGKHHQTYITNLNNLLSNSPLAGSSLEKIVKESEGPLYNNAAQVWNHTFFFECLTPNSSLDLSEQFLAAIQTSFGSLHDFMEAFNKAALSLFGSGWVWLSKNSQGELIITQESNAGNPMRSSLIPLLTCDVWEHAYYLDYQNRRADFLNSFWKIVNWELVDRRFLG